MENVASEAVKILLDKLVAMTAEEFKLVRGFKQDLKHLKESLRSIRAVLDDAHERQVEDRAVKDWLDKLENLAYDADNVLDEINYENLGRMVKIKKKPMGCLNVTCDPPLAFRWKMAHKIKNINVEFNNLNVEADRYNFLKRAADSDFYLPKANETDSYIVEPAFVGREHVVSNLVKKITSPSDEFISVFLIVGMGGLGKTTLARKIFNHQRTQSHFDQRIWICVSDKFDVMMLFKKILEHLGDADFAGKSREGILKSLHEKLKRQRYLLVLDDLWNEERQDWEDFKNTLLGVNDEKGNSIMVTTRGAKVASIVNPHEKYHHALQQLNDDECWSIIKAKTFGDEPVPTPFEIAGREVARQCRGVPLAAKVIGGALVGEELHQWNSIKDTWLTNLEGDRDNSVMDVLKISFDRLPSSSLKACFAYCSLFEKDEPLERDSLIEMWMAEGLVPDVQGSNMETTGNRIFQILLQNSFFQEPEYDSDDNIVGCKMHDLVHDLACSVSNSKSYIVDSRYRGDIIPRVRYLYIADEAEAVPQIAKENTSYLRTLMSTGGQVSYYELYKNLQDFKNLRALSLLVGNEEEDGDCAISIAKLIHLRFVSLVGVTILPDSICKLYNLQTLYLLWCPLEEIPMIAHMPLLKKLVLCGLSKVRSVKPSFYGESYCSSTSSNVTRVSFRSLKSLEIIEMENLTAWTEAQMSSGVKVFPCLEYFRVSDCGNLTVIPSLRNGRASLKTLAITSCNALEELADDIYNFPSLEVLEIDDCRNLQLRIHQKGHFPLRSLTIRRCDAARLSEIVVSCTTSLQFLKLINCSSFPKLAGMGR